MVELITEDDCIRMDDPEMRPIYPQLNDLQMEYYTGEIVVASSRDG